ncbi:hypothetical protein GCM10023188_27870 [Pontibacter saemangeumensis]|uniref:8-amino-7-oxononanoate synthase n=1 Tax=Pontibacter saemangeumensis TaxID=1084525 RepID=A0ABP8LUL6_9BACT
MDDFTSALYLGLHNPADKVQPWRQLTTGVPAALRERAADRWLAKEVARMQGLEKGVIAPSSLHLFWDVMSMLGAKDLVLADDKVYQIARWGLERAACHGAKVIYFKHHDAKSLQLQLQRHQPSRSSSVLVVSDGWCPHCGKAAPLPAYLAAVRKHKGLLLLDDTQAFGVLGKAPSGSMPYGEGGGGLLQWFGLSGPDIITICSLAKGFGVPLAVLSGSATWLKGFLRQSETRLHCSPVSAAHVHAAQYALAENRRAGAMLRQKLLQHVLFFKAAVSRAGFTSRGSFFPVQTLSRNRAISGQALYQLLSENGIRALLLEPHSSQEALVGFCLSAAHTTAQLKRVAECLFHTKNSVLQTV